MDLWQSASIPLFCVSLPRPQFRQSRLENVTFINCVFTNPADGVAFSLVRMTNVTFAGGRFRNSNGVPTAFSELSLETVLFRDIVWDGPVTFREFGFSDVIFRRNDFRGGVTYTEGSSAGLIFRDCRSGRPSGLLPASETVTLSRLSANNTKILGCDFAGPTRLAAAAVRQMEIVNSTFAAFSCVDAEDPRKILDATRLQLRNASVAGAFDCAGVKLTASAFAGVGFAAGASFDGGALENVAFVDVAVPSAGRECHALSFNDATLVGDGGRGGQMRNVTVGCLLSLRSADVRGVAWTDVTVGRTDLRGAVLRQEFLGDDCCAVLCGSAGCKCDVAERTVCPRGSRDVRLNARACLLGGSTVLAVPPGVQPDGAAASAAAADAAVLVAVRDLTHGHVVRDGVDGPSSASPIYFFSHRTPTVPAGGVVVVTLTTAGGHRLTVTGGHLVYAAPRAGSPSPPALVAAASVAVGDALLTANGSRTAVASTRSSVLPAGHAAGLYAPHSVSGSLLVDGLRVSCFTTAVRPAVAAAALSPVRAAYAVWGAGGVRWASGLEGGGVAAAPDRWWPR